MDKELLEQLVDCDRRNSIRGLIAVAGVITIDDIENEIRKTAETGVKA